MSHRCICAVAGVIATKAAAAAHASVVSALFMCRFPLSEWVRASSLSGIILLRQGRSTPFTSLSCPFASFRGWHGVDTGFLACRASKPASPAHGHSPGQDAHPDLNPALGRRVAPVRPPIELNRPQTRAIPVPGPATAPLGPRSVKPSPESLPVLARDRDRSAPGIAFGDRTAGGSDNSLLWTRRAECQRQDAG